MKNKLINLALFQLGWLVCVLGGNVYAAVFTLLALSLHQWLIVDDNREWTLIGAIVLCGCLWDIAMVQFGVIRFASTLPVGIPLWLGVCGCCLQPLSCTACCGCVDISGLRQSMAAVVGPVSYWFGANLTDAELRLPVIASLAIMAAGWAVLFPCGIYYAAYLRQK